MRNASVPRAVVTILMNLLVVLAVLMAARVIVEFFGALASQSWGEALITLTDPFSFGAVMSPIKSAYGGFFDTSAAIVAVVLLFVEWALSLVRAKA